MATPEHQPLSACSILREDICVWLPTAYFTFFVASLVLRGWPDGFVLNMEYPFMYSWDGVAMLSTIKKALEDSYFHSFRLGYPFGADFFDYPMSDAGNLFILQILGRLFGSEVAAFNLYFLLSFPVVFVFSYGALRAFALGRPFAVAGALVFVFLPFHFFRLNHLFFTLYFVVPVFLYFGYRLFVGATLLTNEQRVWSSTLAYCLVFGGMASFGVYYAVFGVIVLFSAAVAGAVARRDHKIFLRGACAAIAITGGVVVNVAPNLIHSMKYGANPEVARRSAAQSEIYGLKFTQLLLPHFRHRVSTLREVAEEYARVFPLVNENQSSSLGGVGSVGVLVLLGAVFCQLAGRQVDRRLVFFGLIFAVLFVVTTIGGLSTLFALFVSPQIRGWNRASVFLGFTAIAAFFLMSELLLTRYAAPRLRILLVPSCAVLVVLFALWDQTAAPCPDCNEALRREYLGDRAFVQSIEAALPPGAAIYQLPYMIFPEQGRLHNLDDYGLAIGFLHSTALRWSYAGMRGREGDLFYRALSAKPLAQQLEVVQKLGMAGIYIARKGYADHGAGVERELTRLLGAGPTFVHSDHSVAFYQLTPIGAPIIGTLVPREIMRIAGFYGDQFGESYPAVLTEGIDFRKPGLPSFVAAITGVSGPEPWGRWSDARRGPSVKIELVEPLPREFSLVLKAFAFGPNADHPLRIEVGGASVSLRVSHTIAEYRIKLHLPDSSARVLELISPQPTSPQQLNPTNKDNRLLGVGLAHLGFEL